MEVIPQLEGFCLTGVCDSDLSIRVFLDAVDVFSRIEF